MPLNTEKYKQAEGLLTLHQHYSILRRGEIATEGVKGEEASNPAEKTSDTDAVVAEIFPGINSAKSAAEATLQGPDPAGDVSCNKRNHVATFERQIVKS